MKLTLMHQLRCIFWFLRGRARCFFGRHFAEFDAGPYCIYCGGRVEERRAR